MRRSQQSPIATMTALWGVRAGLVITIGLTWSSHSSACDCPHHSQVLPPEKLPNGSRYLAPTNTKVWVIETEERHIFADFSVSKHGSGKLTKVIGQNWNYYSNRNSKVDCRLHYDFRASMISPLLLEPNQHYDVIREFDHKTKVMGSFWTGSQRDDTPPVISGPLSCTGEDGNLPSEATCNFSLPAMNIRVTAHDENTPESFLLYRVRTVGYGQYTIPFEQVLPVLAVEPNHVRLTTGNACEGSIITLPTPFEPGRLELTVMDLAGNESQIRSCDMVGPRTYDVRKALERVTGCPAFQPVEPKRWHPVTPEKRDWTRWWIMGLSTLSALLSIACLALAYGLLQRRR